MPRVKQEVEPDHLSDTVNTVARNLRACIKARPEFSADRVLADKAEVGHGSIERMRNAGAAVQIDTLEKVARVFGLEPWHLMIPGLDPANPPRLAHLARAQLDALEKLRKIRDDLDELDDA